MKYTLEIDDQFKLLIPPLSSEEREQLEQNIAQDGCREPLCVWNSIILDGHNRYEICTRLGIPFTVVHVFLKTRDDAIAWICANQLGRRNISERIRRYLIGKRYEAEKNTGAFNPSGMNQHGKKELRYQNDTGPHSIEPVGRTRERLADEYHVSEPTVARYGHYTKAIDNLAKIDPQLSGKILSGKIKMTHGDVLALSSLSPFDVKCITSQLSDDEEEAIRSIKSRQAMKPNRPVERKLPIISPVVSIKEPPVYDPDAAVGSLILTIPSWINAIERAAMEADYASITPAAHLNLRRALRELTGTAQAMADIMEETAHEQ